MSNTKIDSLSAHEFMDRCYVIESMIGMCLQDHIVYHKDKYLKEKIDNISKELCECYQYSAGLGRQ